MELKKIIFLFLLVFLLPNKSLSLENKILVKVDNEIITYVDVLNEINYLKALNPEINQLDNDKIFQISKNSIIREKVKKIEIFKRIKNFDIEEKYLDKLIYSAYSRIGIKSKKEFQKHLDAHNVDINTVNHKFSIEALWNELIFFKYKDKVKIDESKLREEISKDIASNNISYFLYEIVFNSGNKDQFKKKLDLIENDIFEKGFENAALIHSISDTAKIGGKLGWIKKNSLSEKIKKEISKINVGEFTQPLIIPGGFLILKISEKKQNVEETNIDKELKALINNKTNIQLNQFSNIYFNKIKKDILINEI